MYSYISVMVGDEKAPDVAQESIQDSKDSCPNNGNSGSSVALYGTNVSTLGYVRKGNNESRTTAYVENDAVIAKLLQEEFSRVALEENSGYHSRGQTSVVAQEWNPKQAKHGEEKKEGETSNANGQDKKNVDSHDKVGIESRTEKGKVETCTKQDNMEEASSSKIEIKEDSSDLGSEVGKRLNKMVSIPHVPKVNGDIPSLDEQISDHERMLSRLQLYGLVENKVLGDGNCQFRSLADQLYQSPLHHEFVREQIVKQLKSERETYEGYLPMGYNEYMKKMSKNGEWGDHVTLQAAADWFGVKIFMLTSFKDTCYIEILPHKLKSNRVVCLSFWAEVHYNSIYPEGELPESRDKKKKK